MFWYRSLNVGVNIAVIVVVVVGAVVAILEEKQEQTLLLSLVPIDVQAEEGDRPTSVQAELSYGK